MSVVASTKDLGVTVTSTFKTSLHCQKATNRARLILFQLRRGFPVVTLDSFRPLFLALMRPILEYGQQASSPYLRRDIALMERHQRLVTRMVTDMKELPYEERLGRLNIISLERHRLRGDLLCSRNISCHWHSHCFNSNWRRFDGMACSSPNNNLLQFMETLLHFKQRLHQRYVRNCIKPDARFKSVPKMPTRAFRYIGPGVEFSLYQFRLL